MLHLEHAETPVLIQYEVYLFVQAETETRRVKQTTSNRMRHFPSGLVLVGYFIGKPITWSLWSFWTSSLRPGKSYILRYEGTLF